MITTYYIDKFWDDEYLHLDYVWEPYKDPELVNKWVEMGYPPEPRQSGFLCDMRKPQPSWNDRFIKFYEELGWKDIGTAYYRMECGTIMPTHQDHYNKYVSVCNLQGREHTIHRAIVFLEDWASGHYFEGPGSPTTGWKAGFVAEWCYDVPHMAANMGPAPRYTLQITGHK
jgi:hypothetical protein